MEALKDVFGQELSSLMASFLPAPDLSYERGVEILKRICRRLPADLCHYNRTVSGIASVQIEMSMNWRDSQRVLYPYPHNGAVPDDQRYVWVDQLCEELEAKFTAEQGESYVAVEGGGDPYEYDAYHDRWWVYLLVVCKRPLFN